MPKFDVSKHEFVPKHMKLSAAEIDKLLASYNISKKQLPKILKKDPAIREMENLEPGDVIKIVRKSATCGESVYYRVVADV
ncbi:MAG: DNA-directed RNA polymerase subunit H [Nanoarchaeota archaeon]|nr:DNA-directed RNA polymerase subunit H [Nanoarchaeota archaeon]